MNKHAIEDRQPKKRVAIIFPGQGSQSVGMLTELSEHYSQIAKTFDKASESLGEDLWAICQDEKALGKTKYTQPALLTASVAIWRILQDTLDWGRLDENDPADMQQSSNISLPICMAGHSLGEYSALCAAGAMSLETAVKLVHKRGQLMQEATDGIDGKMLAVLGLTDQQVISVCEQVRSQYASAIISVANFNSEGQVVVAGTTEAIEALQHHVTGMGKRAVMLGVSVPSHCELMQPASDAFTKTLSQASLKMPKLPVIQNRHAKVEHTLSDVNAALTQQLKHPVLWTKTMQNLADKHIELLIECGPGTVLSNLAKRQNRPITCYPTDKPARIDKLLEAL